MKRTVYTLMLTAWVLAPRADSNAQNCPNVLQCPTSLQTICDPSENDSTYWNEELYTWSPFLQTADLYEGIVDLNLRVALCPGSTDLVTVSYKILLDLNSDLLNETVIHSNNLPPAGLVFFGNGLNPNYAGGDSLWFDKRPVPDNLKFRFALETTIINDTLQAQVRWNTPENTAQFLMPRLPEGQHGILWTISQGNITRTCQYSFKVKDCSPPTLYCGDSRSGDIGADRTFPIEATELLDFVADNITQTDKIALSLRIAGNGTGFPLVAGNPQPQLVLDCSALGTQTVEVWARDLHGNTSTCNVAVTLTDSLFTCTELPRICARPFWDSTQVMDEVDVRMLWIDSAGVAYSYFLQQMEEGCYSLDSFVNYPVTISPRRIADPLNGVTTFDLLLISKHILNVEPLDAPWKIIAADANNSFSVTTNDIVQFRRLILGFVNELQGTPAWRFLVGDCVFPDDPFQSNCNSYVDLDPLPFWAYPSEIRFYGLKTGDVNNSAVSNSLQQQAAEDRAVSQLQMPDLTLQAGEIVEIPCSIEEAGKWQGFQCGIAFDASKLELLGVRAGERIAPEEFDFAQPEAGILNLSWFDVAPQLLVPQDRLFYLRVKASQALRLSDAFSLSSRRVNKQIASEIYTADNEQRNLQLRYESVETPASETRVFQPQPNPFSAATQIPLRLKEAENVQLSVMDLRGKILFQKSMDLPEGAHLLDIPAEVCAQQGVYSWQLRIGTAIHQGKMLRL